jgi:hypothetical protein
LEWHDDLTSSHSLALLASFLVAGHFAAGALEAMRLDVDALETLDAAPPVRWDVAALEPFVGDGDPTLLHVLLVVVAEVVAEVVATAEWIRVARAFLIVTWEGLALFLWTVAVAVVTLEVSVAIEGPRVATGR